MKWFKRLVFVVVVGFCLFYLINEPAGAAAAVRTVGGAVAKAFTSIMTFFTTLAA